jgi:hypothetical protein
VIVEGVIIPGGIVVERPKWVDIERCFEPEGDQVLVVIRGSQRAVHLDPRLYVARMFGCRNGTEWVGRPGSKIDGSEVHLTGCSWPEVGMPWTAERSVGEERRVLRIPLVRDLAVVRFATGSAS